MKHYNNTGVKMRVMGHAMALTTISSNQVIKTFKASITMRNEIKKFLTLRKLTVINTENFDWNPNE